MSSSPVYLPLPVVLLSLSLLVPSSQFFTQSEIEPRNIFRSLGKGLLRPPLSLCSVSVSFTDCPLGRRQRRYERREEREDENENEGVWISKLEPSPVVVGGLARRQWERETLSTH